jgi:hypothetical protein
MRGATPLLPQYAFLAWFSIKLTFQTEDFLRYPQSLQDSILKWATTSSACFSMNRVKSFPARRSTGLNYDTEEAKLHNIRSNVNCNEAQIKETKALPKQFTLKLFVHDVK